MVTAGGAGTGFGGALVEAIGFGEVLVEAIGFREVLVETIGFGGVLVEAIGFGEALVEAIGFGAELETFGGCAGIVAPVIVTGLLACFGCVAGARGAGRAFATSFVLSS